MTTLTMGKEAAAFIMSEAAGMRSRDGITIVSGSGVVEVGTVLGRIGDNSGAITVGSPTFVGTGNGALTKDATPYGANVKEGTYRIVCIEPAANGGIFQVENPDGVMIGTATVGQLFNGELRFTIADGATDFLSGDAFSLAVTIAAAASMGKYAPANTAAVDGSAKGVALNLYKVDATSADVVVAAITRDAEVNGNFLTYHSSVDDADKKAAQVASLATAGIIVR